LIIPKPKAFKINKQDQDRTTLIFEDQQAQTFYMRGAITWPEKKTLMTQRYFHRGFCLIAGMNLEDKRVWIFDELDFLTVDHYQDPETKEWEFGLLHFLSTVGRAKYNCSNYWIQQIDSVMSYFRRQFNEACPKKENALYSLHNVGRAKIDVSEVGDFLVQDYLERDLLRGDMNSKLFSELESEKFDAESYTSAGWALKVLLAGFAKFPYREKRRAG